MIPRISIHQANILSFKRNMLGLENCILKEVAFWIPLQSMI